METNPYQSPMYDVSGPPSALSGSALGVEGKALVVPSGAVLPPVCVRTNEPVSADDMIRKEFSWCSPWVGLLILVSGCLVVLAYLLLRKKCVITYGLHPSLRRKYRKWLAIKTIVMLALLAGFVFSAAADSPAVMAVVLILFIVSVVALFIGNSPLSVTGHRKGMFWVKGCSEEFLARVNVASGEPRAI